MKQYFEHVMSKEPHERRQHAMQIAGGVTAAVFAVWITTLGFRLSQSTNVASQDPSQSSLTAATASGVYGAPNTLYVASTTGF